MLNWFAPQCSVDVREKVWTEQRLSWLVEQFGLQRLLDCQHVFPTREFFPDDFNGEEHDVRLLLNHVCQYMNADATKIDLEFYNEEERPEASGTYRGGERPTISISRSHLDDQEKLIATLAHEVAHDILLGGGTMTGDEPDHERVTDLLCIFLGLGVFAANTAIQQTNSSHGYSSSWSISKHGYLPARVYGYALALLAWVREEAQPTCARFLGTDAVWALNKGLKFLNRTGDSLFTPEAMTSSFDDHNDRDLVELLSAASPSRRVAALWSLRKRGATAGHACAAVTALLDNKDVLMQCEAAATLGALGPTAGAAVPRLVTAFQAADSNVRMYAARAVGEIQLPLNWQTEDEYPLQEELSRLLEDPENHVVLAAAGALAQYGTEAGPSAELMIEPLVRSIVHCRYDETDGLLDALTAIVPETEQFLSAQLADHDPEILRRVLGTLREREATDELEVEP